MADDEALLADLAAGEKANFRGRPCQVCTALDQMSETARVRVETALGGSIGEQTLAEILTRNGYQVGRRAIANHRRQGHLS